MRVFHTVLSSAVAVSCYGQTTGVNPTFYGDLNSIYAQRAQMLPYVGKGRAFEVLRAVKPQYWLYKPFIDQGVSIVIYQVVEGEAATDVINDCNAFPKSKVRVVVQTINEPVHGYKYGTPEYWARINYTRAWSNNLCSQVRKAGYAFIGPTLDTADPAKDAPITGFWCDFCDLHYYGDPRHPGWWENYVAWQMKCFIGLDGVQKPVYCTEFGCQTWNHTEDEQQAIIAAQQAYLRAKGVKMMCVYQFSDQVLLGNTYEGKCGVYGKKAFSLFAK